MAGTFWASFRPFPARRSVRVWADDMSGPDGCWSRRRPGKRWRAPFVLHDCLNQFNRFVLDVRGKYYVRDSIYYQSRLSLDLRRSLSELDIFKPGWLSINFGKGRDGAKDFAGRHRNSCSNRNVSNGRNPRSCRNHGCNSRRDFGRNGTRGRSNADRSTAPLRRG